MRICIKNKFFKLFCLFLICGIFSSCISNKQQRESCSRIIASWGIKNDSQLSAFFLANNSHVDCAFIKNFAAIYIEEAKAEGINSDIAFVQMCLETGFLRFGNLVTEDMHNYCGLGAIYTEHRGEVFATEREGIRAHIQHLHAYGTPEEVKLQNALIDNRYKWVKPRGKAIDIYGLSGTWAADKEYGLKLDELLTRLETF